MMKEMKGIHIETFQFYVYGQLTKFGDMQKLKPYQVWLMMGFVFGLQGITNFNFPKFIFLIKSSPVGYPSSAVGFSTAPLGPGWISFQWCDSLTIWRNKIAKPKPQDWVVQPLYFLFNTEILTSCLTGKKR